MKTKALGGALGLGIALLLCACSGHSTAAPASPTARSVASTTSTARTTWFTASGEEPGSPLDWAQKLLGTTAASDTGYRHKDEVVEWRGFGGATKSQSQTDCSGLINHVLTRAYGLTAAEFKQWLGASRPLAKDYYSAITAQRGFILTNDVSQMRPGDLIAVRYVNSAPGDDTGHVMLVDSTPVPRAASKPIEPGMTQWDVEVIDSATSGHGPLDSRSEGSDKSRQGLGKGTLRLYVDASGAIAGYSWSDLAASQFYAASQRPIAIGRLAPSFRG